MVKKWKLISTALWKTFALSCLIFAVESGIHAQESSKKVKIEWGQPDKMSKRETVSSMVGHDGENVYVLRTKAGLLINTEVSLVRFNSRLNEERVYPIALPNEGTSKRTYLNSVLHWKDEMLIFTEERNNKAKRRILRMQEFDKRSFRGKGRPEQLATINYEGKWRHNSGDFSLQLSLDSNKLLVHANLPYDKEEAERFDLFVYEPGMELAWKKEITLPYTDELFSVQDFQVDEAGDVYVLGRVYDEKAKEKRRGTVNYRYEILAYREQGEYLQKYPVEIDDRFLTDMKVAVNQAGDLLCAGFWSDKGTFSIKGSYFLRVDRESGDIQRKSFEEFGIDFITQHMTEKQEKKARKKEEKGKAPELYEYDLDDIVIRPDGGAILVGEQYYVQIVTTTVSSANGGTTTRTTYYYHYNDIIVVRISPEGDILWNQKIPKKQVTTNDGGFYSSYTMAEVGGSLFFLFNDNPRNLFKAEGDKTKNMRLWKESLVVLVEVTPDGEVEKEALFSSKEVDIITVPKVCRQVSGKEVILFGKRKKDQRLARLTF